MSYLTSLSGVWALRGDKVQELAAFAQRRLEGWRPSGEERAALQADRLEARAGRAGRAGRVAVIQVHGVLVHRGDSLAASSGACSAERLGLLVDQVASDPEIEHVVFDIDSPGGHVAGIPELADKIAALSARKATTACCNAMACSAAYWLAAQCGTITITPSGESGSLGVYLLLLDERAALEKKGVTVVPIVAGTRKLEGASFMELSHDAREHFQRSIDRVYGQFVAAVARGRRRTVSDVEARFGQGRVFDASDALARGLVDRIEPFDATLSTAVQGRGAAGRAVSATATRRDRDAIDVVLALTEGAAPVTPSWP